MGTITDDDAAPTLTIDDVTVAEGNSGTMNATFTVTLSAASGQTVTVDYATANGTATAPERLHGGDRDADVRAGETTQDGHGGGARATCWTRRTRRSS